MLKTDAALFLVRTPTPASFCTLLSRAWAVSIQDCLRLGRSPEALTRPYVGVIAADLPRTFPEHARFSGKETDACSWLPRLRNVLLATAQALPEAGYLQGMNLLAGFLLCVFDGDEEAAFHLMTHVVGRLLPGNYTAGLDGLVASMALFQALLADRMPALKANMDAAGFDLVLCFPRWMLCVFVGVMPTALALRVWDALILLPPEAASDVMLRSALATLQVIEKPLLACGADLASLATVVRAPSLDDVDIAAFLMTTFGDSSEPLAIAPRGPASVPAARVVLSPVNGAPSQMRNTRALFKRKRGGDVDDCAPAGSPALKAALRAKKAAGELFTPISKAFSRAISMKRRSRLGDGGLGGMAPVEVELQEPRRALSFVADKENACMPVQDRTCFSEVTEALTSSRAGTPRAGRALLQRSAERKLMSPSSMR